MKQLICAQSGINFNGGSIHPLGGGINEPFVNHSRAPWPVDGTFRNLIIADDIAASKTWTLRINEGNTALTCVTDANGDARIVGVDVSVAKGNIVYYFRTAGFHPETNTCIEFEGTNPHEHGYVTGTRPAGLGGGQLGGLFGGIRTGNNKSLASITGTIAEFFVLIYFNSVDVTKGCTVYLKKNGIAQDGTGGTPDTRVTLMALTNGTISALNFQLGSIAPNLSFVPGDVFEVWDTAVNGGVTKTVGWGVRVDSPDDYFMFCSSTTSVLNSNTLYAPLNGLWQPVEDGNPDLAEAIPNIGGVTPIVISGIQSIDTGPQITDPNNLYTMKLRVNSANPANQPLINCPPGQAYTVDNNLSHIVVISDGDRWDTQGTPLVPPITTDHHYSYYARAQGGTLTVIKSTSPPTAELFDMSVSPDLLPATFQLTNGASQVYSYVVPGTYDVEETAFPANWSLTGYSVSNGSPHDAVTVAAGEDVTVTVFNTKSAIPGCPVGLPLPPVTSPPGCVPELG